MKKKTNIIKYFQKKKKAQKELGLALPGQGLEYFPGTFGFWKSKPPHPS